MAGGTAWSVGELIHWDNVNRRTSKTSSGNKLIGVAVTPAADGQATGRVRLNGAAVS